MLLEGRVQPDQDVCQAIVPTGRVPQLPRDAVDARAESMLKLVFTQVDHGIKQMLSFEAVITEENGAAVLYGV